MDEIKKQLHSKYVVKYGQAAADSLLVIINKAELAEDIKKIIGGLEYSDDVKELTDKAFIAEIVRKYISFDSANDIASFALNRPNHITYQLVFEDESQHMLFIYTGDDFKSLEHQLKIIYPCAKIRRSHSDVAIIDKQYNGYDNAFHEFRKMKDLLGMDHPELAKDCREKTLEPINGSNKRAIKTQIGPNDNMSTIRDVIINITVNAHNVQIGNNNHMVINNVVNHRAIHKEWIKSNPILEGELSKKYHNRVKLAIDNPMKMGVHTTILKELGYRKHKLRGGNTWVL